MTQSTVTPSRYTQVKSGLFVYVRVVEVVLLSQSLALVCDWLWLWKRVGGGLCDWEPVTLSGRTLRAPKNKARRQQNMQKQNMQTALNQMGRYQKGARWERLVWCLPCLCFRTRLEVFKQAWFHFVSCSSRDGHTAQLLMTTQQCKLILFYIA